MTTKYLSVSTRLLSSLCLHCYIQCEDKEKKIDFAIFSDQFDSWKFENEYLKSSNNVLWCDLNNFLWNCNSIINKKYFVTGNEGDLHSATAQARHYV